MIIARKYSGDLLRLVSEMVKDYWSLVGIYRNKRGQVVQDETWAITDLDDRLAKLDRKWQERFKEYAKNNSPKMIQKVLKQSDIQLKETLKDWFAEKRFMLFDKEIPIALRQVLRASIEENVMYISDLPVKYSGRVRGAVYRAVTGGGTLKDLQVSLRKYAGMSARHAKLVATDQINKAFVNISAQRMKQAGITKYMWVHTNAGKTHRPYHKRKCRRRLSLRCRSWRQDDLHQETVGEIAVHSRPTLYFPESHVQTTLARCRAVSMGCCGAA